MNPSLASMTQVRDGGGGGKKKPPVLSFEIGIQIKICKMLIHKYTSTVATTVDSIMFMGDQCS